jgi:hypothetical protein
VSLYEEQELKRHFPNGTLLVVFQAKAGAHCSAAQACHD